MHLLPLRYLAVAVAAAVLAAAVAATAAPAPDWAPAQTYPQPAGLLTQTEIGFSQGGAATAARVDFVSRTPPLATALHVQQRPAGGTFADQLTVASTPDAFPEHVDLAVAPNGAAVVVWTEATGLTATSPLRFRASYRAAGSPTWEAPTTIVTDPVAQTLFQDGIKATIAADGTAAVAVTHVEPNSAGEFEEDTSLDVAIHPAGGAFGPATRVSRADSSVAAAALAFDASDNLTMAWMERISEGPTPGFGDDRFTVVTRRRPSSTGVIGTPENLVADNTLDVGGLVLGVNASGAAVLAYQLIKNNTIRSFASTRAGANGQWTPPPGRQIVADTSSDPVGAGVAPDGTAYVAYTDQAECVGAVRIAGATITDSKCLASNTQAVFRGSLAMIGGDAYFAWDGTSGGNPVVQGSRWLASAAAPDAATDLDALGAAAELTAVVDDGDGSAAAFWADRASGVIRATAFDGGAPHLTADGPGHVPAGSAATFTASAFDPWSAVPGSVTWDFGDGSSASGDTTAHVYATPGTFRVRARVADARGNEALRTLTVTVDAPTPTTPPAGQPPVPAKPAADHAAPSVTIALPVCPKHTSAAKCRRLRGLARTWKTLAGTVNDAAPSAGIARVEVTVTGRTKHGAVALRGTKLAHAATAKAVRAAVRGTTWSLRLPKLRAGRFTYTVRAVDRTGHTSKPVTRAVTLR